MNDLSVHMAQAPKYPSLGKTELLRVPQLLHSHIETILKDYEHLCVHMGSEVVLHVAGKIEQGVDHMCTHAIDNRSWHVYT